MIRSFFRGLLILIGVIFLTALTQIGGIVLLLSLALNRVKWHKFRGRGGLLFAAVYLLATYVTVPLVAPLFGRERVVHSESIQPANRLTDLLNRNYIRPELNVLLYKAERELAGSDIQISYLDANFPFFNGFPLLPHLSHSDGKKIDLSFIYTNPAGDLTHRPPTRSGYGGFAAPLPGEPDQIAACREKGYWQYDFTRYFTLGTSRPDLNFSVDHTRQLI
ncbi:MAG: hypothetical protein WBA17_16750, partial [Saprospiraceae bacterium]